MLANILSCSLPEFGENYDRNLLKKKSGEGESNGKSKSLNCVLYALFIPDKFARVCLAPFWTMGHSFWDWSGLCYLRRCDEMLHHLWQTAIRGNCPFAAKPAIHQIYEAGIKNVFFIGNSASLTGS